MRLFITFLFLFSSLIVQGQSLLNLLETDTSDFSIKKKLKKDLSSILPDSLNSIYFVRAFENKNFKKSLKIWNQTIEGTDFSKSSTGTALYAYLLFQNKFEYLSLYTLFTSTQVKEIDPIVRHLWKNQKLHPLWNFIYLPIDLDWQLIFDPKLIVKANSKNSFHLEKDHELMKSLLSLPLAEDFENFDLEWSFLLSLLKKGDKESVVKLLSWFLSEKKYETQKNKINLTIARLLADIGEYPTALSYYEKVEKLSYLTLLAREEMSWIFLKQNKLTKAKESSLVFNHPAFTPSPSMFFVLALAQFRNCDYEGAFQTLISFKEAFSNDSLKYFFDRKDFGVISTVLLQNYRSDLNPLGANISIWSYLVRVDKKLKSQIFLYDYLENQYKRRSNVEFKKLHQKQRALVEKIKKERNERLFTLLKKEYQERQIFLNYFKILEAEILYQNYGRKSKFFTKKNNESGFAFKKSFSIAESLLYFPFDRDEIWLDELFDYKVSKNKFCLRYKSLITRK